ncbi:MAG TPA: RNA 2',3'-cyclic phosphodiesterase [Candidatus Sulfotelmatobacter sp.]|jgi:2'-5' RNA ligase
MRLFVALDIDDSIRDKITRFLDGVREFAPNARWVRPESLHVTLKFMGEKPDGEVVRIEKSLATIEAEKIEMQIRGHGFFPSARAPRVFWIGIEADSRLSTLASQVEGRLSALNIPKETHAFNAHLTLARGGGGSGSPHWRKGDRANLNFKHLQEKFAALPTPEFGKMTAQEFFLYRSQLSPRGSKYTKLAAFPLH